MIRVSNHAHFPPIEEKTSMRSPVGFDLMFRLWEFIRPHRSAFFLLIALSFVGGLMMSVGDPIALKFLIDSLEAGNLPAFIGFVLVILLLATGIHAFNYMSVVVSKRIQNKIHSDIAVKLTTAYYRQPYKTVLSGGEGYHVSRLHEEPRDISRCAAVLTSVLTRSLQLLAGLAVAIYLSWQVTLALLGIVPILVWLSRKYAKRISSMESRRHEEEAKYKSTLGRIIRSYQNVRLFGLRSRIGKRVGGALSIPLRLGFENVRLGGRYGALSSSFLSYAELAVIVVAGLQVLAGNLSIGGLFGFMRAYQIVMQQVNGLAGLVPTLARLNAAVLRHDEYLERASGTIAASGDEGFSVGSIVNAKGVQLGYGGRPVLESVDLELSKGESLLVCGKNGAGKSTLALFLTGFLEPEKGEWGHPGLDAVSASFADSDFFPGTVSDSFLGLGDPQDPRSRIGRLVGCLGLQAHLQEDPNQLSQGQKAKLRLALALAKRARLYVLDEPLSNIDAESKITAARLIREHTRDAALVVISHEEVELIGPFDRQLEVGDRAVRPLPLHQRETRGAAVGEEV
jgi:ATP-binding cassette, subfamily B, bacterial